MTNPTPHGQVPEALRLAEEITNLECSSEAVAKTIAAAADELCRLHVENASLRASHAASPTPPAEQQAVSSAAPGEPPGIQALMCVISSLHSLRDTAHFSDEEGELTNDLCTLRDWAYAQTAAFQPSPKAAPDCHHRPPCDECAALAAQETHHEQHTEQS